MWRRSIFFFEKFGHVKNRINFFSIATKQHTKGAQFNPQTRHFCHKGAKVDTLCMEMNRTRVCRANPVVSQNVDTAPKPVSQLGMPVAFQIFACPLINFLISVFRRIYDPTQQVVRKEGRPFAPAPAARRRPATHRGPPTRGATLFGRRSSECVVKEVPSALARRGFRHHVITQYE